MSINKLPAQANAQAHAQTANVNLPGHAAAAGEVGSVENAGKKDEVEVSLLDSSWMQQHVPRAQVDSIMSQAQSLMGSNKFDEAAVFFRRAADLDPSDGTAHHYATMAQYKAGLTKFIKSDEAQAEYEANRQNQVAQPGENPDELDPMA